MTVGWGTRKGGLDRVLLRARVRDRYDALQRLFIGLIVRDLAVQGADLLARRAVVGAVDQVLECLACGWALPDLEGWPQSACNALVVARAGLTDGAFPLSLLDAWVTANLAALIGGGAPFDLGAGFVTRADWRNAVAARLLTLPPEQQPAVADSLADLLRGELDPEDDGGLAA